MPPKRRPRKKNLTKKRSLIGRPPLRALSAPRPYLFKRTQALTVNLNPNDPYWHTEGSNIGKAWAFSLSGLTDHSDFQDLFKYYRLKGCRLRMYFSNTGSNVSSNSSKFANAQILVTIDRNLNGETTNVATEDHYLQSQTAKRFIALGGDRKPVDIYMPLKQGNLVYQTPTTTSNTMMSPKYVSTETPDTPHWGFNMMLQKVDGSGFSDGHSNYQAVKIITTIYLECKKVE